MFLNSAAKVVEYCKDQPILREVSQQRFLRAKTMWRSYHHVTKDLVEAGSKAKHAKREVERLVGKLQYYFLILKQSNYVRRAFERRTKSGKTNRPAPLGGQFLVFSSSKY